MTESTCTEPVESIGRTMLKRARQFFIDHKAIFMKAIIVFAKVLLEPTRDNVGWQNSLVLLRIRDKFMSYINQGNLGIERKEMLEAGWRVFIDEVEHDPFYRDLFQFTLEELVESVLKGEWKPREQNNPPQSLWREPKPYGNLIGRSFKQFIRGGE